MDDAFTMKAFQKFSARSKMNGNPFFPCAVLLFVLFDDFIECKIRGKRAITNFLYERTISSCQLAIAKLDFSTTSSLNEQSPKKLRCHKNLSTSKMRRSSLFFVCFCLYTNLILSHLRHIRFWFTHQTHIIRQKIKSISRG